MSLLLVNLWLVMMNCKSVGTCRGMSAYLALHLLVRLETDDPLFSPSQLLPPWEADILGSGHAGYRSA